MWNKRGPAGYSAAVSPEPETVKSGRPSRAFAWTVAALRFPVVAALILAAFAAWNYLPGVSSLPTSSVRSLLPADTQAERAEAEAGRLFGSPLLPRTAVVQRAAGRLSGDDQRHIVRIAAALAENRLAGFPRGSRALPYLNTGKLLPGSRETSTTAITYLGFPGAATPQGQRRLADRYAAAVSLPDAPARATGFIPGSVAQADLVDRDLIWVEIASVVAIVGILGVYLRSVLAPLVTLAAAGLTYVISIRVVAYLAQLEGLQLENELRPIIVVLLLGVVTDYSVFFMSGMRTRLVSGETPRDAATRATAQVIPIIFTAGLVVAAGLVTLRLASIGFVQALGPAMAVAVLVGLGVSITFVPAAMRILGRALFWPGLPAGNDAEPLRIRIAAAFRERLAWSSGHRLLAVPTVLLVLGGLVFASGSVSSMRRRSSSRRRALPNGNNDSASSDASSRLSLRWEPFWAPVRCNCRTGSQPSSQRGRVGLFATSSRFGTTRTAPRESPISIGYKGRCRGCWVQPASEEARCSTRVTQPSRMRRSRASAVTWCEWESQQRS